jgi:hypothetical protein
MSRTTRRMDASSIRWMFVDEGIRAGRRSG